jgi:hypothetical protein
MIERTVGRRVASIANPDIVLLSGSIEFTKYASGPLLDPAGALPSPKSKRVPPMSSTNRSPIPGNPSALEQLVGNKPLRLTHA